MNEKVLLPKNKVNNLIAHVKIGKYPNWNNRFCFNWEPALRQITITSYDKDPLKNDYIGTGTGTLIFSNDETAQLEIMIDQANKDKFYGKVYVKYYLSTNPVEEILCSKEIEETAKEEKK